MSEEPTQWTEADFDGLSWHDNRVHGLRIYEAEDGSGVLELDIDHILEWLPAEGGACRFRIAPAVVRFRDVTELRIEVDYVADRAAVAPFSIDTLTRDELSYPGGRSFRWRFELDWPRGSIRFESPGFTQELRGPIVTTTDQLLPRGYPAT